MDGFQCQCQDGFSGDHCHCTADNSSSLETDLTCLDMNSSLSWTIPPSLIEKEEDILSTVHVAEVAVTVGFQDVTTVTANILPSPTLSLSSLNTEEPFLGVDITVDGEFMEINTTLMTGTEGGTGIPDIEDTTYIEMFGATDSHLDLTTTPDIISSEMTGPEMDSSHSTSTPLLPEMTEGNTDTTNTTQETGDTSTIMTIFSEEDSTIESMTVRLTTLSPGDKLDISSNITSCNNNVCRNGGTCLTTIEGFQCHCRLYTEQHNVHPKLRNLSIKTFIIK